MNKALTVYKASAGSGKTFTLATEYIKLVVRNPQSYRNILAVTFTNKATEEMKMRILSQLYGIWKGLPASESYRSNVCQALGETPEAVSRQAGTALTLLLHNYSYFRVETIDTFFQSVFRNLARELDLTANLRIGLNDTQVEELAVDQLIQDLTTGDVMLQWLMKYIMESIDDDRSWNVTGRIKDFGKTIFRDYYKANSELLSEKMGEPQFFEHYTQLLQDVKQTAKQQMSDVAETFMQTLADEGLTTDDLAKKSRGVAGFFLKLQRGVFDESIENATVADCMGAPEKWYAKAHPRRELIHTLADTRLCPLLRLAVEQRPRCWRLYSSADLTLRHLHQLRLLGSIERKVNELNEASNRFLLSNTQQLLSALISDSDSPFIFEKIGTQLEHIMIDEFQDTSTVQWQNFKVLLQETMSHRDTENLIVGDVKQSIYRWRSGDWRLLNNIHEQFPTDMLCVRTLDRNYRSLPAIVRFNNDFFRQASEIEYMELGGGSDAEQLRKAYADVEQLTADGKPQGGRVDVCLLTGDDYQQQTMERLTDTVDMLTEAGTAQGDIAILVRTNNLIPLIAKHFAETRPDVSIVSDEAFRLDASTAVNTIIQALRLIAHPDDQLAMAFLRKAAADGLPEDFGDHLAELAALPLYELAERVMTLFRLQQADEQTADGQSAYVCAFFDHLSQYVSEGTTAIDAFLKLWDDELCSKTIQSDALDGIRLISIHKSKGLEFDNVIIPFCDWQLEKPSGSVIWCQPREAPFNMLPLVPVDFSRKAMTGTIYEDDYRQEHLQNVVDNLNLLYVAFTRASQNLFVIGRRGAKNSRSTLIEQTLPLLEGTLTGADDDKQPLTYTQGTLYVPQPTATKEEDSGNVFLQPAPPQQVALETFDNPAQFRQSNKSRDFVSGDDDHGDTDYIQLGSVLHHVFSTIKTLDDVDDALRRLQDEGILYDEQLTADRIGRMLRERLLQPRVADWFSPRWRVFNECTILQTTTDGQVAERRPDRVMTDGRQWVVVDFKFGKPRDEYADQVRQYMQLLHQMGHTSVSGFLWFVYSNKIIEVK